MGKFKEKGGGRRRSSCLVCGRRRRRREERMGPRCLLFGAPLMVVFLAALVLQVHAQDDAAADRNDGYAFSGYSCDRDCSQGGDVNFVIAARLNTYEIPGATCPEDGPCNAMGGTPEGFSFP